MLNYNKQKALGELLDVINKGISLLANDYLGKDLCQAYEKYVFSTMQLVDAAFTTNYSLEFSKNYSPFRQSSPVYGNDYWLKSITSIHQPNSAKNITATFDVSSERRHKEELQKLLQRLVDITKILISRYNQQSLF